MKPGQICQISDGCVTMSHMSQGLLREKYQELHQTEVKEIKELPAVL